MSRSNAKKIMSMTNKNVVCIRWGMKYGAHYVNRLYGMVARHLTPPFRFRVGKLKPLQDAFRADPQGIADRYRYEQRLVSREAPGGDPVLAAAVGQQFQAALSAALPGELLLGTAPACRLPGGDFSGQGITSPCH